MVSITEVLSHHGFSSGGGMNVIKSPTRPSGEISEGTVWHNEGTGESKMYLDGDFRSIGSSGTYFTKFTKRIVTTATSNRIKIPVTEYKPGIDILNLVINSDLLLENFDYAVDKETKEVVSLAGQWPANTSADFDVAVITTIPDEDSRMFLQYEDSVLMNEGQNTVVFNIPEYVSQYDTLEVYQRNLRLFEGDNYSLDPSGNSITLHYVLEEDDTFRFVVTKQIRRGESGVGAGGGSDTELEQAKAAVSGEAYPNLKNRLDSEWQENYKEKDYVETLNHLNSIDGMKIQVKAGNAIDIYLPTLGGKHIQHQVNKNVSDDFIRSRKSSVGTLSSGAVQEATHSKDYEFETGAFVKASPPNYYTTNIGAAFNFKFFGTGFDFQHFADTRGGVIGFSIDGGAEILVSTHLAAVPASEMLTANKARRKIARDLTEGNHQVVATFRGNDPNNAPSTAPARGWVSYSGGSADETLKTIIVYGHPVIFGQEFEILNDASYKETSFRLAPSGSAMTPQWIPEVNNLGTLFADSQKIYFDGIEQTTLKPEGILADVSEVKIVQKMFGEHPDDTQPILQWFSIHTYSKKGIHTKIKIGFLKECFVSEAYGVSLPYSTPFGNELKTGFNKSYASTATGGTVTALTENNKSGNFVAYHTGEEDTRQDFAVGLKIHNLRQALRYGSEGVNNPPVFIQHKNTIVQELKVQPYKSVVVSPGQEYEIEYSIAIGAAPYAKEIL